MGLLSRAGISRTAQPVPRSRPYRLLKWVELSIIVLLVTSAAIATVKAMGSGLTY